MSRASVSVTVQRRAADGAVERKAKTHAGRRIIASRVRLPCLCGVHGKKCMFEKERRMYMHTKREEKSGIYSSGIEKSLGNGERDTTPARENNNRERREKIHRGKKEDRESRNIRIIEAKVMTPRYKENGK